MCITRVAYDAGLFEFTTFAFNTFNFQKRDLLEWRGEWDSNPRVLSDMGLAIPRPTRLDDPRPFISLNLLE